MSMTMSSTATASSAMSSSTSMSGDMGGMDMGGMDMDMGTGSCKVSMLWNWNTIDACKPPTPTSHPTSKNTQINQNAIKREY